MQYTHTLEPLLSNLVAASIERSQGILSRGTDAFDHDGEGFRGLNLLHKGTEIPFKLRGLGGEGEIQKCPIFHLAAPATN